MRGYELVKGLVLQPDQVALEFGSERGYYSGTSYMSDYFKDHTGTRFISIDPHPTLFTHQRMTGEEFIQNVLPGLGKRVRFAYLDCFDWEYPHFDDPNLYPDRVEEYAKRGVVLNNENSQATHLLLAQMLQPYTAKRCLIVLDDTWSVKDGYDGKGGTAVPWLLENGYKLKKEGDKWLALEK